MSALLHASSEATAAELCVKMLEPLLLALQRPDGAQTPLLALTFAALTRVSASLLTSDLCEAIIRSLTAGLAQIDAADWASWVSFGVNAVPLAAAAKPRAPPRRSSSRC